MQGLHAFILRRGTLAGAMCVLGILFASPAFVAPAAAQTTAQATNGTLEALQEKGYARLIYRSTERPDAAAVISNGVLIVQFASPVVVDVDPATARLPGYITAAKRDPDGTALRFALGRKLTAHVMPLGDALYIDLLPQGWVGFPPPLPAEALTEATLRSRKLAAAEAELRRFRQLPHKPLQVETGTHPTFYRFVFTPDRPVSANYVREGERIQLTFNANIPFDPAPLRAMIPEALTNLDVKQASDSLTIQFDIPAAVEVRSFQEDGEVILDILRTPPAAAPATAPQAAPQNPGLIFEPRLQDPSRIPPMPSLSSPPVRPKTSQPRTPETARHAFSLQRAGGLLHFASNPQASSAQARFIRTASQPEAATAPAASPEATTLSIAQTDAQTLGIFIPQPAAKPVSAFIRGSTVWLVMDGITSMNTDSLMRASNGLITDIRKISTPQGMALALDLNENRTPAIRRDNNGWLLTLSQNGGMPAPDVALSSGFTDKGLSFLQASLAAIGTIHRIEDPVVGDQLVVVTSNTPINGIARARDLLELRILESAQGFVIQPIADDLIIQTNNQGLMITRPNGLSLSVFTQSPQPAEEKSAASEATPPATQPQPQTALVPFDADVIREARVSNAREQSNTLMRESAAATSAKERTQARLKLAQALLVQGETTDAKAVLDLLRADSPAIQTEPEMKLLSAISLVLLRQYPQALEELKGETLANNPSAALWRSVAEYELGNNGASREEFRKGQEALSMQPDHFQELMLESAVQASLNAGDTASAHTYLEALRILPSAENSAKVLFLRGLMAESTNKPELAIELYNLAIASNDEMSAAQARLHAINVRLANNTIDDATAITELEMLATGWRGDSIEAEALTQLSKLYTKEHRWRDALESMRTAIDIQPERDSSRQLHADMAQLFSSLFLGNGDRSAPPSLDSVALFYDFKDLTPPGRRGDEMIRKLADRLTDADLLSSAAGLLEYQINNRLSGAARAQVATQAALLHIMDHNPTAAYQILQSTRQANLPGDLVRSRFMLESRALSELGRIDLALEMIDGYEGSDVVQLRADILWHAERWQQAAESFELTAGDRWKGDEQLDDNARQNIMRAAIAYVRANDTLGLERLRTKFMPKMSASNDARAFDVVTAPVVTPSQGEAFKDVVRSIASVDTLDGFLTEYKQRYPQVLPAAPAPENTESPVKGS